MSRASPDARAPESALPSLTDLGSDEWAGLADLPGARPFHPRLLARWLYDRGVEDPERWTDLPRPFRTSVLERYRIRRTRRTVVRSSRDGTRKFLLELDDGRAVESVLIPEGRRTTLCVSTQVGCGVRCAFCASGLGGFVRNLTSGEIVEQFLEGRRMAEELGRRLTNLVLMGGGEPLNNFEQVKRALGVLTDRSLCGFGARRITLSTIGIPAKIDRLEELGRQIRLAISLHAPDENLRGRLIPGLDRVPLDEVLAAAQRYFDRTGREVTFEYAVLGGVNDAPEHGRRLARLVKRVRGKINLIPWNPVPGLPFRAPSPASLERLVREIRSQGVRVTVRRSRGSDIEAACGQLRRAASEAQRP